MSLKLFQNLIYAAASVFGREKKMYALAHLAETIAPVVTADAGENRTLQFYCFGPMSVKRAQRLLSKEPDTIEWLDAIPDGAVFWDIGANVGAYTLYAALKPKTRVVAFEPVAGSFYALNRNISLNAFQDRVSALCIGLSDTDELTHIYLKSGRAGDAGHALTEARSDAGAFDPVDSQAVPSFKADTLIDRMEIPTPTHIKIDVDGFEKRVVAGMADLLANPAVRSVLVEMYDPDDAFLKRFTDLGFSARRTGRLNHVFERT